MITWLLILKSLAYTRHALLPLMLTEQTLSISAWDVLQHSPQDKNLAQVEGINFLPGWCYGAFEKIRFASFNRNLHLANIKPHLVQLGTAVQGA